MRSTTIGVVIPIPLLDWIDERAKSEGMTRSRFVADLLLEASALDLELSHPGRKIESERRKATKEIAEATGQIPIGNPNLGWH